jgi:hypothetical protein
MRMFLRAVTGICAAVPAIAGAQGLDINVGDDVAEIQFRSALGLKSDNFKQAHYEIGFFYKDDTKNSAMGELGFEVSGGAGANAPGFELGAGVKGYLASLAEYDVGAISLGVMARYAPPIASRFAVTLRLNYAPSILTFNDGDALLIQNARFGYEILPEVEIYAGYRKIELDFDNQRDIKVDDGWHLGLDMQF